MWQDTVRDDLDSSFVIFDDSLYWASRVEVSSCACHVVLYGDTESVPVRNQTPKQTWFDIMELRTSSYVRSCCGKGSGHTESSWASPSSNNSTESSSKVAMYSTNILMVKMNDSVNFPLMVPFGPTHVGGDVCCGSICFWDLASCFVLQDFRNRC